jgi:hypothetical protein
VIKSPPGRTGDDMNRPQQLISIVLPLQGLHGSIHAAMAFAPGGVEPFSAGSRELGLNCRAHCMERGSHPSFTSTSPFGSAKTSGSICGPTTANSIGRLGSLAFLPSSGLRKRKNLPMANYF